MIRPHKPAELTVIIDSGTIGCVICDQPNKFTPSVLTGAGRQRGFCYEIPETFRDGEFHTIELLHRNGCPVPFSCSDGQQKTSFRFSLPSGVKIEGFVDGLAGAGIFGWVTREDLATGRLSGAIELLVSCNNEPIATIIADRFRADVAEAKGCGPNVGFHFQPPPRFATGRSFQFGFRALPENKELQNSPMTASFPMLDMAGSLGSLHEMAQKLCSEVWALERRIQQMISAGPYTIREYDAWARSYLANLQAAAAVRRRNPPVSFAFEAMKGLLISIVMPTFKPDLGHFKAAVDSVFAQSYGNWELLIVDDCSRSKELSAYLQGIARADSRITVIRHSNNKGISAATNTAIAKASGDYVAMLDHDDLLVEEALEIMVDAADQSKSPFAKFISHYIIF